MLHSPQMQSPRAADEAQCENHRLVAAKAVEQVEQGGVVGLERMVETEAAMRKGDALMDAGDVEGAREFYRRAVDLGR